MNSSSERKIYVVIGTRAQMIKMAPIMSQLQRENIQYEFVYTAQHKETIDEIIRDFGIKKPDRILYRKSEANTILKFLGWWGTMCLKIFKPKGIFPTKGLVLTHGDTTTCAWAAFVGKLAGCKVAHVESGLRSFNIFAPFPEELMRLITFKLSDIYFCPNKWAIENLKRYKGIKIDLKANPLFDAVQRAMNSKVKVNIPHEPFAVVSIHRYENIFTHRLENKIIPLLEEIADNSIKLVFVLHPTTREVLKKDNSHLYKRLDKNTRILLKPRYPFIQFIQILDNAEFVITDGGSNQEELSYLGIPTLLFRESTERTEGLDKNVVISNFDNEIISNFVKNYQTYRQNLKVIPTSPSELLVNWLIENNYVKTNKR